MRSYSRRLYIMISSSCSSVSSCITTASDTNQAEHDNAKKEVRAASKKCKRMIVFNEISVNSFYFYVCHVTHTRKARGQDLETDKQKTSKQTNKQTDKQTKDSVQESFSACASLSVPVVLR